MGKLKIEYRSLKSLSPYVANSRTHSDAQVEEIAASIKEFGFTNPILIDEFDGIVAGHGRARAARLLNLKEVPCIVLSNLSETQRRAYVIADNRIALNAGWDPDMLANEIGELKDLDFDVDLLGFGKDDLDSYLAQDDEDEPEEKPKGKPKKAKEAAAKKVVPDEDGSEICPTCGRANDEGF